MVSAAVVVTLSVLLTSSGVDGGVGCGRKRPLPSRLTYGMRFGTVVVLQ